MRELELTKTLHERSKEQGYKIKIVSIAHVKELKKEIKAHHHKGLLDEELYDEFLASFDFEFQQKLAAAKSLVIGSIPQPQLRVVFKWEKDVYPVIIPPAYNSSTNMHLADRLKAFLAAEGYQLKTVRLPEKLLAVRSGMARYGKNNITYIEGMGSFHMPVVFISDFPCQQDSWIEPRILKHCETCSACMKACPTDAISSDRFLLHAERCITFHNERSKDFAKWLSPAWHNCLVGCMNCQKVCPANKDVVKWIEAGEAFESEETALILNGASDDQLPGEILEKLKKLDMMEYYDVLGRNLKMLMKKQQ